MINHEGSQMASWISQMPKIWDPHGLTETQTNISMTSACMIQCTTCLQLVCIYSIDASSNLPMT